MKFYRYSAIQYASLDMDGEFISPMFPNPTIVLSELNLYKETPKGYWIGFGQHAPHKLRSNAIWVSKTAKKRYAYPTKEQALTNYIKRTQRRLNILIHQVEYCKVALSKANEMCLNK